MKKEKGQMNVQSEEQKAAEKQDNNACLVKIEIIKDSPFVAVGGDGKKWKIGMAEHIVSVNEFDNLDDCIEYVNSKPYELIFNGYLVINKLNIKL